MRYNLSKSQRIDRHSYASLSRHFKMLKGLLMGNETKDADGITNFRSQVHWQGADTGWFQRVIDKFLVQQRQTLSSLLVDPLKSFSLALEEFHL